MNTHLYIPTLKSKYKRQRDKAGAVDMDTVASEVRTSFVNVLLG